MAVGVARVLFHFSQGSPSGDGGSGELGGWFAWQSDSTVGGQRIRAVTDALIGGSGAVPVAPTRTSPATFLTSCTATTWLFAALGPAHSGGFHDDIRRDILLSSTRFVTQLTSWNDIVSGR